MVKFRENLILTENLLTADSLSAMGRFFYFHITGQEGFSLLLNDLTAFRSQVCPSSVENVTK